MLIVLQLLLLLGILYVLLSVGFMVFILLSKLDRIVELLIKLDKPTKEEIINKLTTTEAQKEAIRIQSMLDTQYHILSKIFANDVARVFGGKK